MFLDVARRHPLIVQGGTTASLYYPGSSKSNYATLNHRGTSASSSSELRAPILKSSGFLESRPMDLHDFAFFLGSDH